MSTTTAPEKKSNGAGPLLPPDEKFWGRYSPHGEAPLSLAGSVSLHLLVGGGLLLFGIYLAAFFFKDRSSVPVEPVRLMPGGVPGGVGPGNGRGPGAVEDLGGEVGDPAGPDRVEKRAALTPVELKMVEERFDKADVRLISGTEAGKKLAALEEAVRRKLAGGLREGGPGKDGGGKEKGEKGGKDGGRAGPGPGGPGPGGGKVPLSPREKRMLRWHMAFTASSGPEYLAQLRDLGAILAFPVTGGEAPKYKVVRELKPGAELRDDDLTKIQRIYWIDDKPDAVRDILKALGVKLPATPGRFIAFMPEELEKKLFEMERNYVVRTLKVPFKEDQIDETRFKVVRKRGKYQPELVSVSLRR